MSTYHTITLQDPSGATLQEYRCAEDQSLLVGSERLGTGRIPIGCRGGGCGVCKVELLAGEVVRRRMSRAHISEADEAAGIVLSCRIFPRGDVAVRLVNRAADVAA